MDHFFQIRSVGRERGADARGVTALGWMAALTHRARLGLMVGGVHYRHPGCGSRPRRPSTSCPGASLARDRRRLERERESGPGLPLPAARGALRAARGDAPDRPRDVAGRARQRGRLRGPPLPRDAAHELAPVPVAAAGADPHRRRRRAEDAPPGGPVRRRHERLRRARRIAHKYAVLREHCERLGRDFDEIERTTNQDVDISPDRGHAVGGSLGGRRSESPAAIVDQSASWPTPAPST